MKDVFERPVKEALVLMTVPALVGMVTTFLFQLVDTYFVGKLGTRELTAISFAYPIYFLIVSLFLGIESGVASSVGKAFGEKNPTKAQALTTLSLTLFVGMALVIGGVGYFTIGPVFTLLGADPAMIPLVQQYMEVLYVGMAFLVGGLTGVAALRAKGLTTMPDAVMAIGGVVNLVLDYAFIFGFGPIPALGLRGAALATVISWMIIFLIIMMLIIREKLLSFKAIGSFVDAIASTKEVFTIGLPAAAAQILVPISVAVVTRLVSDTAPEAVAAYGIATKVESLGLAGITALSVILTPLIAQNFGAKQQKRLDEVVMYSGKMTVYWALLFFVALIIFATPIARLFTDDTTVIGYTAEYFYYLGISFPFFGLALITTSIFNGVYQPRQSLLLTLVKALALTIPFAIVGSFFGLQAIWVGLAAANMLGGLYAGRLINRWLRKNGSPLVDRNPVLDYVADFKNLFLRLKGGRRK